MEIKKANMEGVSDPRIALNDQFRFNYRLVESLQETLSPDEKDKIQSWCDKLLAMNDNLNQIESRCEYMWFIFVMLQAGSVRDPFMQLPPSELPPLTQFLPWQVYDEVLSSIEPRMKIDNNRVDAKSENQA